MHSRPEFASGPALVADVLRALLPPPPVRVSDFIISDDHPRWLANEGGGYVGRWNHEEAPYLIAPMDALSDERYLTVAVVGPGQCGKTEIARNWLFTTALSNPADMLWYSGSEPLVVTEVKTNITRMIQDHADLANLLVRKSNSLSFKRFGPMTVQFLAGIMSNFISKSAPRIYADEWDMICEAIPAAKEVVDVRRQTFGERSKFLATSHPDLVEGLEPRHWKAGIMKMFRDSTRKIWYWQCPECGAYSSPNPTAKRVMEIHYDERAPDDEIRDMARLFCPVNGCLIENRQRRAMNLGGQWIGLGQDIDQDGEITGDLAPSDTDGYWIVGAMSPFIIGGIGALALTRARAERQYAIDRDRKSYRQVLSKHWGMPPTRDSNPDEIDAGVLAARTEENLILGTVANGVRFITVFIDVQGNRFELLARGWCEGGRSVVVDFRPIPAAPGTSAEDWDDILKLATTHVWPLADNSGRGMKAIAVGFDSGGAPGVTLQGYQAWKRLKAARGVKLLGKIDGRPAYSVLPMKGASTANPPKLSIVFPNAQRNDRFAQAKGEVPVAIFAPNAFKDELNDQLQIADGAPWGIRFPKALAPEKEPPYIWFEQLTAETKGKTGRWERKQLGQANEALDLMVGTHVLAFMLGVHRLKWDGVLPPWAREAQDNPYVVARGAPPKADTPAAVTPVAEAPAPAPSRLAVMDRDANRAPSAPVQAARPGKLNIITSLPRRS